MMKFLYYCWF